jgi:hypothetical protein
VVKELIMNEKIRELRRLAERYTLDIPAPLDAHEFDAIFDETFAELIVRECARVARITPCPYTDVVLMRNLGHTWDMACVESGNLIMKHFGVEK